MGTKRTERIKAEEEERIARERAEKTRLEELRALDDMPPLDRQSNNDLRQSGPTAYTSSKAPMPRPRASQHELRRKSHEIANELRRGRWSRVSFSKKRKAPLDLRISHRKMRPA